MNAYIKYVNKAIKKQSRKKQNKSCDKFCKKDYMVQMDSVFRKSAKNIKYHIIQLKQITICFQCMQKNIL